MEADDVNDSVGTGMEREDRVRKHGYEPQGQVQGHPLYGSSPQHQSWSGKTAAFAPAVISCPLEPSCGFATRGIFLESGRA